MRAMTNCVKVNKTQFLVWKRVSHMDGITVLGAPVGWREFVREKFIDKIEKVRQITELLHHLRDPHSEFVLLRSCLSLPKVMFLLRALNTTEHRDLLDSFDSITRGALCRILGSPVTDHQWGQAKLPVAMGGLGLRAAGDHASVAHATSLLSSHSMIHKLLMRREEDNLPNLPQLAQVEPLNNRACCREVKIPNQYGGVIL